jgi:flagellar hook-associated protein 3 FlgL
MRVSTESAFLRAVRDIQTQQAGIGETQSQIGSGRRLVRPSDGPTESARAVDLNQALSRLEQFSRNRDFADQQLSLVDATLTSANNVLLRARDLSIQANTSVQTKETRDIIRAEIEQRLEELLDLANTRDGNGDFLFSGSRGNTQPFALSNGGAVYNGDQSARNLQISANRSIDISDSGFEVFQQIRNGNGSFLADIDPTNTGAGLISPGSVIDRTTFQPHDFRIVFTSETTFDVINDTTATTVRKPMLRARILILMASN